jgi:hypothetical protein
MSIARFPTKLPPPDRIGLAKDALAVQLQHLSGLATAYANKVMTVNSAPELAAIVRDICATTQEASDGWKGLSDNIKRSWGI